jgi:hypothetical protein
MKKMWCIGLMALMMSAGLLPLLPTASAADPGDTGGHVDWAGDWIVVSQMIYHPGSEIHLTSGNLVIKNGASLTLDQAGVLFSSATFNGQYGVTVEKGGTLIIKNKGYLDWAPAITHAWKCHFLSGSIINFPKASVYHMGSLDPSNMFYTGCYVGASNATFEWTVAGGNDIASVDLFYVDAPGVVFRNTTFSTYVASGVSVTTGASVTVDNCTFKMSAPSANYKQGVYVYQGSAFIRNSKFTGMTTAVNTDNGEIHVEKSDINNNTGYGIQQWGLKSKITSVDNRIADSWNGIDCNGGGTLTLDGVNKITHNLQYGINLQNMCTMTSTGTELRSNVDEAIYMRILSTADFSKGYIMGGAVSQLIYAETMSSLTIEKTSFKSSGIGAFVVVDLGTDLTLKDNTFDATGMTANSAAVIGLDCTAELENNRVIESGWGFMAMNGATVYSTKNNFGIGGLGIMASYGASVFSEGDTFKSSLGMSTMFQTDNRAMLYIQHATIEQAGNPVGLTSVSAEASMYIFDSTVKSPGLVVGGIMAASGGYVSLINVTGGNIDMGHSMAQPGGMIQLGWHVDIQVQWQNGVPAPEANVNLKDKPNYFDLDYMADMDGMLTVDVMQFTVGEMLTLKHNPYNFSAELNGMIGNTSVIVDKNLLGAKAVIIQIDDTASPELNITFPANDWATSETIFTMNGTADDIGSSLDSIWVNLDASMGWAMADGLYDWEYELNLTEGDHTIRVEARDVAGMTTRMEINVTVDLTAPEIAVTLPTGLYVTTNEFYLNGTTEDGAYVMVDDAPADMDSTNFSAKLNKTDGRYSINITSTDCVGNERKVVREVIVDTVAPKVASDRANGAWVTSNNFTLTGTTDGNFITVDGANATVDLKNGTWSIKESHADGNHEFFIEAKDLAGNKNKIQVKIEIDTVPPVLTVKTPAGTGTFYTNNATLSVSGTVVNATALTLNGVNVTIGTNGTFSKAVTLTEGTNTVTVIAKDLAGNEAKWTRTVVLDKTAPKVTITSPKAGLVTNVAGQTVTGTVDDLTAAIKQGTTNVTNTNGTFTTSYTLVAGVNTITVMATDRAGNVGTASITVTLDTTSQLTITTPKKLKVTSTSDTLTISGTAEKGSVVTINDMAILVDNNGAFSIKYTLKEGKNTLNVKSVDPAGNPATTTLTVTYNDEKQYSTMLLLGLGILLMIIGLVLGLVVGRAMAKPKAPPPIEEEAEETKPAPKEEEETPFTPEEEEPEEAPKPETKGALKDKQGVTEAPTGTTETKPAPPKAGPKTDVTPPKATPPKSRDPDSLEDLLKDLDKKKSK